MRIMKIISSPLFPYISVLALFMILQFLFTMQYTQSPNYVKYEEAAKQASYKLALENMDGSVDVIFNIPEYSDLAKRLRNKNLIQKKPTSETRKQAEIIPKNGQQPQKSSKLNIPNKKDKFSGKDVKNTPVSTSGKKTLYPITLDSKYLINNPDICESKTKLHFLVIVHTATNHFQRRRTIRETWANKNILKNGGLRIAFMLGKANDKNVQLLIQNENTVYRDIVQGDFVDSYHNLTHKGVLAYRWITEYCNNVELIVKVDDDMFVNIFSLLNHYLPLFRTKSKFVMCQVRPKGTSIIQRQSGKWKVIPDEFKNMTHYPVQYCNGFFVLMTPDMIRGLYKASYLTPFFWVDDVYLYGLLPFKVGGVTFKAFAGNVTLNENNGLKCFTGNKTCNLAGSYAFKQGMMEKMWYASLDMFKGIAKRYVPAELLVT